METTEAGTMPEQLMCDANNSVNLVNRQTSVSNSLLLSCIADKVKSHTSQGGPYVPELILVSVNLVPRVLSLPPSRKYPGFGWSRVSLKQTAPHQGGLAFLQEAKGKANAKSFQTGTKTRNGSH